MEKKQFDTCPDCGNYVEGNITKKSLLKIEGSVGLVGGGIGLLVGAFLGNEMEFAKIGKRVASMSTGYTADKLDLKADYEFHCPNCGKSWVKNIQVNIDTIPDEVMENRRLQMVEYCNSKCNSKKIWTIIFTVVAFLCWLYCHFNDSSYQKPIHDPIFGIDYTGTIYNYTWIFWGFIMIVAIIGAIITGLGALSAMNDRRRLNAMSTDAFRLKYKSFY
jgi:hypothetical protein